MFRVLGSISGQHDLRLVFLAVVICAVGSYTALSVLARAGATGRERPGAWIAAAGVVCTASVWSMHFVALLAYRAGMVVDYDVGLTVLSIARGIIVTGCAFYVLTRWRMPLLGGAIFGGGIAVLHYTGLGALKAPASFHWHTGYVMASVLIGIGLGAGALKAFAAWTGWRGRIAAAGVMTLAVASVHFTGMAALTLVADPAEVSSAVALVAPQRFAIAIAIVMLLILSWGLYSAVVDQHFVRRANFEAKLMRAHIAALKASKGELEETTARLAAALKASAAASQAKSQFLATMSHELRTPLNAIIGFSEMITKEVYGPLGNTRYASYVQYVHDSGKHLLGLVNDVLDFSKMEAGRLELEEDNLDLAETVAGMVRMIQGQADAGAVAVRVNIAAHLPQLCADERRVRQILLNLVGNAIKFTRPGGAITISAFAAGGALVLQVKDTGIGIAAADIPRALERFSQIDNGLGRKHEGAGLGLPLAKRLIEIHGGTLTIESALGEGTTVTARFPASRTVEKMAA